LIEYCPLVSASLTAHTASTWIRAASAESATWLVTGAQDLLHGNASIPPRELRLQAPIAALVRVEGEMSAYWIAQQGSTGCRAVNVQRVPTLTVRRAPRATLPFAIRVRSQSRMRRGSIPCSRRTASAMGVAKAASSSRRAVLALPAMPHAPAATALASLRAHSATRTVCCPAFTAAAA